MATAPWGHGLVGISLSSTFDILATLNNLVYSSIYVEFTTKASISRNTLLRGGIVINSPNNNNISVLENTVSYNGDAIFRRQPSACNALAAHLRKRHDERRFLRPRRWGKRHLFLHHRFSDATHSFSLDDFGNVDGVSASRETAACG